MHCLGTTPVDGSIQVCRLRYPYSLMVSDDNIYIGENAYDGGALRKITFQQSSMYV